MQSFVLRSPFPLCLLFVLGGCQLRPLQLSPASTARGVRTAPSPTPSAASRSLAPGELRIRLAAFDGQTRLRVLGTERGSRGFERVGQGIRDDTGETRSSFVIRPANAASGLQLEDRHYRGLLLVELDEQLGLRVMNHVALEEYVAGVVPSELILWSAEESEIAAQAIAARTYALRTLAERSAGGRVGSLWDDTRDQVYVGLFQPAPSAAARRVEQRYRRGLELSRGRVLVAADGELYDVRFHASCGGMTCSPAAAFPLESDLDHAPVACAPCREIGARERTWSADDERQREVHWTWTADATSLSALAMSLKIGPRLLAFEAPEVDANQRWKSLVLRGELGSRRISLLRLRRELGPSRLKSGRILNCWPALGQRIRSGVFFEGLGRGHGAGLCQVGSHAYAVAGWSARQILLHYLPGSRLVPLPLTPQP